MAEDRVWKSPELTRKFLEGVRGAIPYGNDQINILLRIIQTVKPKWANFLDLGCGDGVLGNALLKINTNAAGYFLDFSEPMLAAARARIVHPKAHFIQEDYGDPKWINSVESLGPFDIIVSGFSIHHQPDIRKREIYREIFNLLNPEGIFLNLEHVASYSPLGETLNEELFVDSLTDYNHQQGEAKTRQQISQEFYNRADKSANILAPVEIQCNWLREIGFKDVDCFFKVFELALFGGIKPA